MRILACVKRVPAPGAQIALTADARAVDARSLAFTTSPHEECAVEEAIRLVELHGGDITVLTVGPPEAEEQLRFSISVGAQHAVLATNEQIANGEDPDPQATAHAIVAAVRGLEGESGPFDVLLFGNESADSGNYQVGVRVARALGRPIVNGIKAIDAGLHDPQFQVVGVKEGINLPRYPTLPGRLRSKKAEVQTVAADAPGGALRMVRFETPVVELSETEILGRGADGAGPVVDLIYELGLA